MGVTPMKQRSTVLGRIAKAVAMLAGGLLLAIAMLFGFLAIESRIPLTLPRPTGEFAVGRTILDWKDDAAVDSLAPAPGAKRELLAWIWYPTSRDKSASLDTYWPADLQPKSPVAAPPWIFRLLTRTNVRVHSVRDAALAAEQRSYPVLI